MNKIVTEQMKNAKAEFINIIQSYILPLFDIRGSLKIKDSPVINNELIAIKQDKNEQYYAYFYPRIGTKEHPSPFYCKIGLYSSKEIKKRAASILRELLKVTEYDYNEHFSIKRNYGKGNARQTSYKNRTLDLAFELGMCQWIVSRKEDVSVLHTIICRMIEWAGRTYEGRNIPFGIVIDFSREADETAADYLHFLMNDNSAVFTDGIFTGILLDKKGKVLSFLTRGSKTPSLDNTQDVFVPYQFIDIAQNCLKSTIGIIALTNGEILLIKDQAVCFAKRGRKWISFDWNSVYTILRNYFLLDDHPNEAVIKKKIQAIYCTILDVSFAHTGGCLALVLPAKEKEIDSVIKERIDLFMTGVKIPGISRESREKIEVLTYLLGSSQNTMRSFFEIEKPLRKEILSLDGATVVSMDGTFYCAGSIVAVPGGSSGGGRTAASKKLAKFGVGIKISEDGYVEAYGIDLSNTEDDSRTVPLFKFK